MNKKIILKSIFWSGLTAAIYFPASIATTIHLSGHEDPDIQEYVDENIEQIIERQEEKIGMTYPKERPKMEYLIPDYYQLMSPGIIGAYRDDTDTLYLSSGILVEPGWELGDFIATIATFNNTASAKRTLDHELAHFYCDKVKEQVLGKEYHLFYRRLSEEELIAHRLINEGIAKYVENTINGEDDSLLLLENWPVETEQFSGHMVYQCGYALVKPIIDKHREKGIQFLLFNPPLPKELLTPEQYQERILTDIRKLQ